MKQTLIPFALALSLVAARADLVLKQNIESSMLNGTITTQIKGDKIRVDIPSSPQGSMSTIMDLSSGDSVTLLHQQKTAMKFPGTEVKQMVENMKAAGTNAPPPQFHDTGKAEKVGEYDTEVYSWSSPDGVNQTVWVAKNFPDYAQIKVQMDKLNDSQVAQLTRGTAPDVGALPGMVVKTQMEMNGQKITSTLVSAKEEPVDASIFQTPKDYQEMTQQAPSAAPNQ
ncbi:MAG TPA: DUF4412 domain-containing protein [Candidatus Saccharimonadales bacterium]|nr:DUF4412 domain-containing protein [Candidatus Saccharimonadales bacterium]